MFVLPKDALKSDFRQYGHVKQQWWEESEESKNEKQSQRTERQRKKVREEKESVESGGCGAMLQDERSKIARRCGAKQTWK